jgi:hypothetical protein
MAIVETRAFLLRTGTDRSGIRDFSHIGPILDGSVEDGVADWQEAGKTQAVAVAMRRATGQKLEALRYMSLDVRQLYGVARL